MIIEQTLRVTSIRSQSPRGFGGCIFAGRPIDNSGNVSDAGTYYVVKATGTVLAQTTVQVGQWWKVSGEPEVRLLQVNGYKVSEYQIEASEAVLARPSGEHIVSFIANNTAFEGIGEVKSRKLWDTLGPKLYDALDAAHVDLIATVLTPDSAKQVVDAWAQYGDSRTMQWLQTEGIELKIGRKILQFFGRETPEKIQEDPYRLLSFCASWRKVDALARDHFKVAIDDPRRLKGAIEEACYRIFSAGNTSALPSTVIRYLEPILGLQKKTFRWRTLIAAALKEGETNGSFLISHDGIQPIGAMVMERQVAKAVSDRIAAKDTALMPPQDVDAVVRAYEAKEGIGLNTEQLRAVQLASEKSFLLITGGAGVGKTTVLKAMYNVYDLAGIQVIQTALAGRAAKRMQEATGRPACTIASLLRDGKELSGPCVVVIDESGMVDIITMHKLVELLGSEVRLVMAGDSEQLMPVGPGLVLHALIRVPAVPTVELKVVKRYGGAIAAAASDIRNGTWPSLQDDESGPIAFINCTNTRTAVGTSLIGETVLDLYKLSPSNTQILCSSKRRVDGVMPINDICQASIAGSNKPMMVFSIQNDQMVLTGFNLGDPILCTRNMWDRGLQNGSLGILVEIADEPNILIDEETGQTEPYLGWVLWDDGVRRPVTESMLDDLLLGYAITVHKAQGSQWPRIIVPLTGSRLLDRTLIYTAITRAQSQVLIVGDEAAARAAVERPPRSRSRHVALDYHLTVNLAQLCVFRRS